MPNLHGDIFATLDATGALQSAFMTGPFGEVLPNAITQPSGAGAVTAVPVNTLAGTSYAYLGQHQKMTETSVSPILGGITQMGARVYISALGRFLQVDPKEGGNDNNYAYVNDPVNGFDLDGNAGWFDNIKKGVQQAAKWAWQNREGIAAAASIGLMFVPGVGAAVGVARVAMLAQKFSMVARVAGSASRLAGIAGRAKNALNLSSKFTNHALKRIAERGGSRLHALYAKNFGRPIGPRVDNMRRWSYNYETRNTRVAVNSRGKIITYIRYTNSWWKW